MHLFVVVNAVHVVVVVIVIVAVVIREKSILNMRTLWRLDWSRKVRKRMGCRWSSGFQAGSGLVAGCPVARKRDATAEGEFVFSVS